MRRSTGKNRRHPYEAMIAILLAAILLLPSGCRSNQKKISLDTTQNYRAIFTLKKSITEWMEDLSVVIGSPIREPDFEIYGISKDEQETRLLALINSEIRLVKMDANYHIVSEISLGEEGDWSTEQFFPAKDGSFFLLLKNTEQGLWKQKYALRHFDSNGRELASLIELSMLDEAVIQDIDFNGEQLFGAITDSQMILFDTDGTIQSESKSPLPGAYQSILFSGSEQVVLLSSNKKGMPLVLTYSIPKDQFLLEKEITGVDLSDWYDARLIRPAEGDDAGFYLETEQRMYVYDPESEHLELCFDKFAEAFYSASTVLCSGTMMFETIGYWGFSTDETDLKNYGFYIIETVPRGDNITTIRIGLCCDYPARVSLYEGLFKREYFEYEIDIIDYSLNTDKGSDPVARLNADLLSGNGPDIICLSPEYVSRYESAGELTDLNKFVAGDPNFDSGLYLPNVPGGTGDPSSFRFLAPFVRVNGLMGKQGLISELAVFNSDDFSNYLSGLPENTHIMRHDTKENLFQSLYPFYQNELFSYDSGVLRFDRDEFLRFLSFCEEHGAQPYTDSTPVAMQFQTDETLLLCEPVINYEIYLCYAEYFGGDVGYIGAPGISNARPVLDSDQYYGISTDTRIPDAAWAFLKYLISSDIQERYASYEFSGDLMPVLQSSLNKMIEEGYEKYQNGTSQRNNLYSDWENEQETKRILEIADAITSGRDFERTGEKRPAAIPFPQKETAQAFREAVFSAGIYPPTDPAVRKIIFEELAAYFSGEKSKEQCLDVIEDRLRTYINETSSGG